MKKRCVLEVRVDGSVVVHRLKGPESLEFLQGIVGGLIERVSARCLGRMRGAWVNEEGAFGGLDLDLNRPASRLAGQLIFGPMAVVIPDCTGTSLEGDVVSLAL